MLLAQVPTFFSTLLSTIGTWGIIIILIFLAGFLVRDVLSVLGGTGSLGPIFMKLATAIVLIVVLTLVTSDTGIIANLGGRLAEPVGNVLEDIGDIWD